MRISHMAVAEARALIAEQPVLRAIILQTTKGGPPADAVADADSGGGGGGS